jgi:hypothetical protein
VLSTGISLSVILLILHSASSGLAAFTLTAVLVLALGTRNRNRVLQDPEKMKELKRKTRRLERMIGRFPLCVGIDEGIDATG